MMMISGNWATLLLPIDTDESIDFVRLEAELEAHTAAGMDGVYSNGSAGEFHCQTEAEYDSVQMLLAETCEEAGTPFIIGACHTDPLVSAGRVARAAALRPSAIQVILPDWVTVTDAEAVDFMAIMRENAGGIPLVLYNPPHAKRVLSPRALRQLLDTAPDVVGVKLVDGDAAWYDEARQWLSGVALFVPGHHLATGVREGVAAGAFSNVACLSPIGAQKWTDSMTEDLEGALELESRIQRFMDDYIVPFKLKHGYCNAALDKLVAAVGGWAPVGTRLRRPYRWIDQEMVPRIRQAARDLVPELV